MTGAVTFHHLNDTTSRVTLQVEYEPDGLVEHIGALTNPNKTLTNYDLGQFKRMAGEFAGRHVSSVQHGGGRRPAGTSAIG